MKHYWIFGLALVLCLGLVACGQIEDTNGEQETGLATITKQELLGGMGLSTIGSFRSEANGTIEYSVKKFSGVEVFETVRVKEGQSVTFDVESTLESGNLYIYVRKDGKIVGDLSIGKGASLTLESPQPGEYELCLAGESASFKLTVEITTE